MSNFIKQRYVINLENEKVVINSDDRFFSNNGQQMSSLSFPTVEIAMEEESADEFHEGLYAEEVYVEPQPTPEEILEETQLEAERILADAREKAAQIEKDANRQATIVYEQKSKEGYNAGTAKAQTDLENEKKKVHAEYEGLKASLSAEYEAKLDTLEHDLVDVMIQVFHKVFRVQFDNKKQILLHLIKDTLLGVDAGKVFHIRVAESNFKFIESHVAEIKEKIGNDVYIDIINDMLLDENDCIIETETGVFNCGIDMVLDNLEKDIKSLCG